MPEETIQQDPFDDLVSLRYRLYNSLFLTLPFSKLSQYGTQLPLFAQICKQRLEQGDDPRSIVEGILANTLGVNNPDTQLEVLFLYLQLIERQVLLFDAIERAAQHELLGTTTDRLLFQLKNNLPKERSLRIVLTAHPTQFYPEALLGLIQDITEAVKMNRIDLIRKLLLQLGRTSFRNPKPPTPEEEAEMLIDQFGRIFYEVFVELAMKWPQDPPSLELGFWPGGDRDGNPNVTSATTRHVCEKLRAFAVRCHLEQVEHLRRRITFKGMTEPLLTMKQKLQNGEYPDAATLLDDLKHLLERVEREQGGLFRDEVRHAIEGVALFGFHFASLDLRDSSRAIGSALESLNAAYSSWDDAKKIAWLASAEAPKPIENDLIELLLYVPQAQKSNGPRGMHRFIVSHTMSTLHLLEIFALSRWYAESRLDIVPLFESIDDMRAAPEIMAQLFAHAPYTKHLKTRGGRQTVMLGFSDGTKDGGYVTCNREIQQCKEKLHALAETTGVTLVFFDGRGGPPARGGGSTHKYYAAVAEKIPFKDIQLTVQGQSISSYYGSHASAMFNLTELLAAFLPRKKDTDEALFDAMSEKAYNHYKTLRSDPLFIPLLLETTPLPLLGELNIASRPPKRADGKAISLDNLRAISFVGAWSLMKINIPAFYGLGLALEEMLHAGQEDALKKLYRESMAFRVLIGNAVQALRKSYLPLTQYTESDPKFGPLWKKLRDEQQRTITALLKVTGKQKLELDDPIAERSVSLREEIVLPLLAIQHCALQHWREDRTSDAWKKMLLKSIPPSINASRNSA